MSNSSKLKNTLEAPQKPSILADGIQWLSGEGAGSWFHIREFKNAFEITRYSPEGRKECEGVFEIINQRFLDLKRNFEFTHLSHCQIVSIKQDDAIVVLERKLV